MVPYKSEIDQHSLAGERMTAKGDGWCYRHIPITRFVTYFSHQE